MLRNVIGGWTITFDVSAPITSRFKAIRFGVTINAGDYFALLRMIRALERQDDAHV